jgi:glycosyltransferase involved in cell wall biosynthesis
MKAAILYSNFLDHNGNEFLVGGIQTYLLNLARLSQDMEIQPTIYQWANIPFKNSYRGIDVIGVPIAGLPYKKRNAALYRAAAPEIDLQRDILIFGADHKSIKSDNPRHISIQHGVAWDLPAEHLSNHRLVKYEWAAQLLKKRIIRRSKREFENCRNTVCVDYNFLNWYRTAVTRIPLDQRTWVIPNFTAIPPAEQVSARDYDKSAVRLLFARRFFPYRGTRIFAQAIRRILDERQGVSVTFAGEGPDEEWLRQQFAENNRVEFIKYQPDDTLDIHLQHDIAVVPSLACEGSALAVAEAMATGSPVVATGVGGITNMIINRYNGLLVTPEGPSLFEGITELLDNSYLRQQIGQRAYQTAASSFSLEQWQTSWRKVLEQVSEL